MSPETLTRWLNEYAAPLARLPQDLDPLIARIGPARCILLGEATLGSHEFHALRARLTQRLIEEGACQAVAVDADWAEAYRVNRFVRHAGGASDARAALAGFECFPAWRWRNSDMLAFVEWLHAFNSRRPPAERVGFYGLDLYGRHRAVRAVLRTLDEVDPPAAARIRERYAGFESAPEGDDARGPLELRADLGPVLLERLRELQRRGAEDLRRDGLVMEDEPFFAEQHARLVRHAGEHYPAVWSSRAEAWNTRERHLADTLSELLQFLGRRRPAARIVTWAHNTHVGDARAAALQRRGELSLGQLARTEFGPEAVLIGFTTYGGSVAAASAWGGAVARHALRPALRESVEAVLHGAEWRNFTLMLGRDRVSEALRTGRLQRAVGAVYRPETEPHSHFLEGRLGDQYDAIVHLDTTTALEPLDPGERWIEGESVTATRRHS